jgi:hypothetical protein
MYEDFLNYNSNIYDTIKDIESHYKLKEYIHEEFINKYNNIKDNEYNISIQKLSKTKSCIDKIKEKYNDIEYLKKNIEDLIDCSEFYNIKDINKQKILKYIYNNRFIPLNIIKWIEENENFLYNIQWDNINITILNNEPIPDILIKHIIIITKWLFAIKNNDFVNIYIYLSDEKKEINFDCFNKTCNLNKNHINSGSSWSLNWIQIYRKEEILKVLIHELIHYLEIDVKDYSHIIDSKCLHIKMHNNSDKILVNEAFTECLAIYLHTLYLALTISNNSNLDYKKIFNNLLLTEEKYTIYQINKIFKNYKIENINVFKENNDFIQHTNVISYFIIKYLFLVNYNYFILVLHNKNIIVKLIILLLEKFYKLKIPNNLDIIDNSLRMSFFELKI